MKPNEFVTTVEQMARTVAAATKRECARERERCALVLDDIAKGAREQGKHRAAQALEIGAKALRSAVPELLPKARTENDYDPRTIGEPELPEVHHMDDVEEGIAMVQGGMHRRQVIGYEGRLGQLRKVNESALRD